MSHESKPEVTETTFYKKKRLGAQIRELYRFRFVHVAMVIVMGGLATLLLTVSVDTLPSFIREGDIAQKDIRATQNYEIVDKKSTERLRQEALGNILSVYDWDLQVGDEIKNRLARLFATAREILAERGTVLSSAQEKTALRERLEQDYQFVFDENAFAILLDHGFNETLSQTLVTLLDDPFSKPILSTREGLELESLPRITVRYLNQGDVQLEETWDDFSRMMDVNSSKRDFMKKSSNDEIEELLSWVSDFIIPTIQFNRQETELRKQKVAITIKDVIIKIKAGEAIVRAGDSFDAWHIAVIDGIRNAHIETNRILKFIGTFCLATILILSGYLFSRRYIKAVKLSTNDLYFLGMALLAELVVLRLGAWFAGAIRDTLPVPVDASDLYYAIPMAGVVMLVRMVLNAEVTLVFSIVVSLLGGLYLDSSLELSLYYWVSSLLGAHGVAMADKRLSIMRAGGLAGIGNMAVILGVQMITVFSVAPMINGLSLVLVLGIAYISGILCAVLAMSLAPIAELIFHYTTDIKLLELANLDHPLLKEMVVRAPGTYHHSHLVGLLAESGARAIGANALLARVACYYHDIGKMKKPQYFIENQGDKVNRHDRLTPSTSAGLIAAHVKDGLDMAHHYKLPPCIVDMIPQHQGTKIMSYFYEKAKVQAAPNESVDENAYRYPGPKPQSREAGIIMLADATEAAVRAMPEKTLENIEEIVKKLMNRHFSDGQFDECELTLKDLHLIATSFVNVLMGIYHNRIEYPDTQEEKKTENLFVLREIKGLK